MRTRMEIPSGESRTAILHILDRAIFYCLLFVIIGTLFSIAVHSIGFGAALILWCVKMLISRKWEPRRTPFDYFFLVYVCAEILSTIFSPLPMDSFVNMKRLFLIFIVYLSAASLDEEWKITTVIGTLFCMTSLLSVFEIIMLYSSHETRLNVFQHYMTTGGLKMIVSLLMLPFLLDKGFSRKTRGVLAALFIPVFVALVLTQTRSSWLGFLCGALIIGVVKNRTFIFAILGFVVLFVFFAPATLQNRALSVVNPYDPSNNLRLRMWGTGWRIFCDHPVVGIGDTDIKQTYIQYTTPIDKEEGGHLHNNFVMLAVTLGLIGFSAVMAIFIRVIIYEFSVLRKAAAYPFARSIVLGAVAVFFGFQVNGLFEWNYGDQEIVTFFWFTLGLTIAITRHARHAMSENREIIIVE
jgi:O-antigen ligase